MEETFIFSWPKGDNPNEAALPSPVLGSHPLHHTLAVTGEGDKGNLFIASRASQVWNLSKMLMDKTGGRVPV